MAKRPVEIPFAFDGENPHAVSVAERQAARFVRNVSRETIAAIRAVIVQSIRDGMGVYDVARLVRPMIGLTSVAARAVMNYRRELLEAGWSQTDAHREVRRYIQQKLVERSVTIAATEVMDALNTGARESWTQARAKGLLGKTARKGIVITPDERLCPVCRALENVTVPLDADFQTLNGSMPGPPFHQRCRCGQTVIP